MVGPRVTPRASHGRDRRPSRVTMVLHHSNPMEVPVSTTDKGTQNPPQDAADDKLAELLRETAEHHDRFEKATPPHNWWDWYARYLSARQHGSTPEEADAAADRYMKDVRGVVAR
jgi:hypothetical protein